MVFENRVARIFGPKREEITEDWRKLRDECHQIFLGLSNQGELGTWCV